MALGKVIREFGVKLSLIYDKSAYDKANKGVETIAGTLRNVGLGAAAAAGTIFGFAEATASNAQQLELYSETLGINAERLQELGFAAKSAANVNREELVGALEGVSKTLDDVRRGNIDAAFTFQRLGLSQDILTNRSLKADQVMMMVADRLKMIQDPIARASIANQVFGSSGAALLPLLLKGSQGIAALGQEARKLGVVIDDKTLKSQQRFQETMNRVFMVLQNVAYLIGGELIKQLMPLVKQFEHFIVQNRKLIASGIVAFIKGLGVGLQVLWKYTMKAADGAKYLIDKMGGVENAVKAVLIIFGAIEAIKLTVALVQIGQAFWAIGSAIVAVIPALWSLGAAFIGVLAPLLPWAAAIGAIVLAVQALWVVLQGGKLEDTWIGQMFTKAEKFIESIQWVKDFLAAKDKLGSMWESGKSLLGFNSATSAGAGAAGGSSNTQNQFSTQVTVQVPPGTSAAAATEMVGDGVHEGLHSMLRQTTNQAAGGTAY